MERASENREAAPTALQRDLASRIVELIHADGLVTGDRLNESRLAQRLGVSRTPVRMALRRLADRGFVVRQPNRGIVLSARPPRPDGQATGTAEDDLIVLIARDRSEGRLPGQISETELMRRYGFGRQTVRRALDRLLDLDVVARRAGYGWRFSSAPWDVAARQESYRFRIVVETAAILEPGFALAEGWADGMRTRHEAAMRQPWAPSSSVSFFEMNAAFHAGLAAASGNRYLLSAVERQNRLRRLSNYHWPRGFERVETNCREHLEILARLEAGDVEVAAVLMRRHLEHASRLRPSFIAEN